MAFEEISVFNLNSWRGAGNTVEAKNDGIAAGHSVIKISPNLNFYSMKRNDIQPVVGVMLNALEINIDSDWQPMGVPKIPIIQSIGNFIENQGDLTSMAGAGEFGSVWMSKQLWRKNGYLTLSPQFRVIDWDGTGKPLAYALAVAKLCLPGVQDTSLSNNIKKLEMAAKMGAKYTSEGIKQGTEWLSNNTDGIVGDVIDGAGEVVNNLGYGLEQVANTVIEDIHDIVTLRHAPPPVKVQIGQYFYHPDMVITGINFVFSKEISYLGPLYVDITVSLKTRKIVIGIDDLGFTEVSKLQSRVNRKIENKNVNLNDVSIPIKSSNNQGDVGTKVLRTVPKSKFQGDVGTGIMDRLPTGFRPGAQQ